MSLDLFLVLALFLGVLILGLLYGVRVWLRGPAHFDRVDRQGSSILLAKSVMEAGYWCFQPIARFLLSHKVSANQISWCSLACGFLSGCFVALGHWGFATFFATLSAVMDSLDGLVARLSGRPTSNAGEILDASVDRYSEFFFLGGLVLYYRHSPLIQIVCLLALVGSFMVSYSSAKAEALHVDPPHGMMKRPERVVYLISGLALSVVAGSEHLLVIAVSLVAVVSNFSAIERLRTISKNSGTPRVSSCFSDSSGLN